MTMTRRLPLVASLLCAAIVLGAADRAPFTFPRSTPEAQGVSSAALLGFIDAAEKQVDALHSFMLVRHGQRGRRRLVGAVRGRRAARAVSR